MNYFQSSYLVMQVMVKWHCCQFCGLQKSWKMPPWVTLKYVVNSSRIKDGTLAAVQVMVMETYKQNPTVDDEEEIQRINTMYIM